jgi:hypothetical protein
MAMNGAAGRVVVHMAPADPDNLHPNGAPKMVHEITYDVEAKPREDPDGTPHRK